MRLPLCTYDKQRISLVLFANAAFQHGSYIISAEQLSNSCQLTVVSPSSSCFQNNSSMKSMPGHGDSYARNVISDCLLRNLTRKAFRIKRLKLFQCMYTIPYIVVSARTVCTKADLHLSTIHPHHSPYSALAMCETDHPSFDTCPSILKSSQPLQH